MKEPTYPRERILSVTEAAKIVRLSKSKAYELIHENKMPHAVLGGRIVVPESALYEWVRKNTIGG